MAEIAAAIARVKSVLQRRPEMGLHDDVPVTARWQHSTRVVAAHPNGKEVATDMPGELGGSGDQVSPGWLFRAGLASCTATTIAMNAAAEGIEITALEVKVGSRTDSRGFLGMSDDAGQPIYAGPGNLAMEVRIAAKGVAEERLRAFVRQCYVQSPIPNAVENTTPMALQIEIEAA